MVKAMAVTNQVPHLRWSQAPPLPWPRPGSADKDLRRLQGHHREDSAQLYSRDDVEGALKLQQHVIDAVKSQWRPHTPLARGGQVPLEEPPFVLEQFQKEKSVFAWQYFQFAVKKSIFVPPNDQQLESDSSTSSDSESSSSSIGSASAQPKPSKVRRETPEFDEAEVGTYRSTWHIVVGSPDGTSADDSTVIFTTACGRKFPSTQFTKRDSLDLSSHQSLCTHPGCRKGWTAIGALS